MKTVFILSQRRPTDEELANVSEAIKSAVKMAGPDPFYEAFKDGNPLFCFDRLGYGGDALAKFIKRNSDALVFAMRATATQLIEAARVGCRFTYYVWNKRREDNRYVVESICLVDPEQGHLRIWPSENDAGGNGSKDLLADLEIELPSA